MDNFLAPQGDAFVLAKYDPSDTLGFDERKAEETLHENQQRIAELQNVLYAESERSLLVILQSMDTGGKDPIIRDVLRLVNPQASRVTAFKQASKAEEKRGQFWRFFKEIPGRGEIGVFNRSYYDDVINRHAHGLIEQEELEDRYKRIRLFEQFVTCTDTMLVKIFLHISKDEQKRRLRGRMDDPARQWELSEADFEERKFWDGYMRAYESIIRATNVDHAPWYVINSDRSWFRDAAASMIIATALERMDPKFPPPSVDLSKVELVD